MVKKKKKKAWLRLLKSKNLSIKNQEISTGGNRQMSISIDEWGYIQTMEYYSAINRNEALMHVAMWMDLEAMLSKRSHS